MRNSNIDRGKVTDWIEQMLEDAGYKAKNMIAPSDAGWRADIYAEGTEFIPYIVINPQTSTEATGSLGDSVMDWDLPYTLSCYGIDRKQVEDLADDSRATVVNGKGAVFAMRDGSTWKVISIRCTSIGGVGVNQNITPHAYSQSDSILIRLSKNL